MGSSKISQYTKNQIVKSNTAKAIGHPARVFILEYLALNGHVQNKELPRLMQLDGSTIVQHLQVLMSSGLIRENFIGGRHFYFLSPVAEQKCNELKFIFRPQDYSKNSG